MFIKYPTQKQDAYMSDFIVTLDGLFEILIKDICKEKYTKIEKTEEYFDINTHKEVEDLLKLLSYFVSVTHIMLKEYQDGKDIHVDETKRHFYKDRYDRLKKYITLPEIDVVMFCVDKIATE